MGFTPVRINMMRHLPRFLRRHPRVFLASREDMFHVNRLLDALPRAEEAAYIGIVGGLGTFNFIEALAPRQILLIDMNRDQVEYGRCVLELIRHSPSRREFVEAFFSRRFLDDEKEFLRQQGDIELFEKTAAAVNQPDVFRKYFRSVRDAAGRDGLMIPGNDLCRRLKLYGPERGTPVGFNYLFFGQGWLRSNESYLNLRRILADARLELRRVSLGRLKPDLKANTIYFHGTNVVDSCPREYRSFIAEMHRRQAARTASFYYFSTYYGLNTTRFRAAEPMGTDIHSDCARKVAAYTRGKEVLEVIPGEHYFGRELEARRFEVVHARDLAGVRRTYEVVVSHLLYGSGLLGLKKKEFEGLLDRMRTLAPELVIVEHNRMSQDFQGGPRFDVGEVAGLAGRNYRVGWDMQVDFSRGNRDDVRNIILDVRRARG
jgi:hypothetical protein